jgi:preprotein translocase subunit SecE
MKKYRELIDSTTVVALTTLVLAAYTSGFDFLISRVVGWLVRF